MWMQETAYWVGLCGRVDHQHDIYWLLGILMRTGSYESFLSSRPKERFYSHGGLRKRCPKSLRRSQGQMTVWEIKSEMTVGRKGWAQCLAAGTKKTQGGLWDGVICWLEPVLTGRPEMVVDLPAIRKSVFSQYGNKFTADRVTGTRL